MKPRKCYIKPFSIDIIYCRLTNKAACVGGLHGTCFEHTSEISRVDIIVPPYEEWGELTTMFTNYETKPGAIFPVFVHRDNVILEEE